MKRPSPSAVLDRSSYCSQCRTTTLWVQASKSRPCVTTLLRSIAALLAKVSMALQISSNVQTKLEVFANSLMKVCAAWHPRPCAKMASASPAVPQIFVAKLVVENVGDSAAKTAHLVLKSAAQDRRPLIASLQVMLPVSFQRLQLKLLRLHLHVRVPSRLPPQQLRRL